MAKLPESLVLAKKFSKLLLYEATGGNLGTKPEKLGVSQSLATFTEKRGLLDSLIKISGLEKEDANDSPESGLDLIRKNINASTKNGSGRNFAGLAIKSASDDAGASEGGEASEDA